MQKTQSNNIVFDGFNTTLRRKIKNAIFCYVFQRNYFAILISIVTPIQQTTPIILLLQTFQTIDPYYCRYQPLFFRYCALTGSMLLIPYCLIILFVWGAFNLVCTPFDVHLVAAASLTNILRINPLGSLELRRSMYVLGKIQDIQLYTHFRTNEFYYWTQLIYLKSTYKKYTTLNNFKITFFPCVQTIKQYNFYSQIKLLTVFRRKQSTNRNDFLEKVPIQQTV